MAAPATATESIFETAGLPNASVLLDVIEACLHARASEWIFLRELRVGTGFQGSAAQRLDGFALNCRAHNSMKRICYEVKTSRADFLSELKQPLKRRIGLRYSNEFYFVTPPRLLHSSELPIECGLVEAGLLEAGGEIVLSRLEPVTHFDPAHRLYCKVAVPAPWRETPGPTWQFVVGMLRNQQRQWQERQPKPAQQQKFAFTE
ncbi:MAG TPA: hypothetical protein VH302_14690 [Bryobacteraceae bacterium]|jgi:hypothetical protein|nr:hypothetical protein [Bryobacteraceae bacterium]